MQKRRILVAPLNWGLGHATRCIPLISKLEEHGFEPIIASNGAALELLKMEFPHLKNHLLPAYDITYTTKGKLLKWKLVKDAPFLFISILREKMATRKIAKTENLSGIISDSRLGVRLKGIPNVIITHQVNVLSGKTTWLTSKIHQAFIRKFHQCWVPDAPGRDNLSGFLGHPSNCWGQVHFLGILSRFEKKEVRQEYDIMILLSGPEPQRSILEKKLLKQFQDTQKKILFVRGIFSKTVLVNTNLNITMVNILLGDKLEKALRSSKLIIARSGYSTIMDLARLQKKAFFIPTPGQYEQEYLALRLQKLGIAPFRKQNDFTSQDLESISNYRGLSQPGFLCDFSRLFSFFKGE